MFSQVMKFVKTGNPKVVILENVQALLIHDKGKSFLKIKTDLENEGYFLIHKVLKCSDYGILRMRKLFYNWIQNIVLRNIKEFFNLKDYTI
jgi:DNA (cytosine-5)-methyltransferase 1